MKDTKKKLITTGLAVVMAMTTVGGVACAAEPVDEAAREAEAASIAAIQPRGVIFPSQAISGLNSWRSESFTATAGSGNYIRYWYNNRTSERVIVYLYRVNSGRDLLVKQMTVNGNSQDTRIYNGGNADSGTYYIRVSAVESGGTIRGNVSAAQYVAPPSN